MTVNQALWDTLISGDHSHGQSTAQKNAAKKRALAAKLKKQGKKPTTSDIALALGLEMPIPVPQWNAIAVIYMRQSQICSCGDSHSLLQPEPFVRFQHRKNGTIKEEKNHPSFNNSQLPIEIRDFVEHVGQCNTCFDPQPQSPSQIDLFTDLNVPQSRYYFFEDATPARHQRILPRNNCYRIVDALTHQLAEVFSHHPLSAIAKAQHQLGYLAPEIQETHQ